MSALYAREGFIEPWVGYLALLDNSYVGMCAFKAPPTSNRVEIACHTFPEFEGRGIATQMAAELVTLARQAEPAVIIAAQTLPEKNASTAVLEKNGFELVGEVEHPDDGVVWEWRHRG
jgi:RimJ/RimL family protein N-acetyltransferase